MLPPASAPINTSLPSKFSRVYSVSLATMSYGPNTRLPGVSAAPLAPTGAGAGGGTKLGVGVRVGLGLLAMGDLARGVRVESTPAAPKAFGARGQAENVPSRGAGGPAGGIVNMVVATTRGGFVGSPAGVLSGGLDSGSVRANRMRRRRMRSGSGGSSSSSFAVMTQQLTQEQQQQEQEQRQQQQAAAGVSTGRTIPTVPSLPMSPPAAAAAAAITTTKVSTSSATNPYNGATRVAPGVRSPTVVASPNNGVSRGGSVSSREREGHGEGYGRGGGEQFGVVSRGVGSAGSRANGAAEPRGARRLGVISRAKGNGRRAAAAAEGGKGDVRLGVIARAEDGGDAAKRAKVKVRAGFVVGQGVSPFLRNGNSLSTMFLVSGYSNGFC